MRVDVLAVALLLGCTQSSPAPIRKPDCVVGAMAACLCEGDRMGWQTCGADRRLGSCLCGDGGAPVTPPPMCVDPFAFCGGRCANLLVDNEHCGRCSAVCPAGQLCFNGSCALLADSSSPVDATSGDAPAASDVVKTDAPPLEDVGADAAITEDASLDATSPPDAELTDAPAGADAAATTDVTDDASDAGDANDA